MGTISDNMLYLKFKISVIICIGSLLLVFLLYSCKSKDDESEYVEDKTTSAQNHDSQKTEVKPEIKKDTAGNEKTVTDLSHLKPQAVISPVEAKNYLGKPVTVKGLVADVYKTEKVAYLNFVEKFPDNPFSAVVFARSFGDFGELDIYEGKFAEVTGIVSMYKGKPQIILNDRSQLKLSK